MDGAERLLCGLGRYTLVEEAIGKVRRNLKNNRVFTVKSMYEALQLSTVDSFPWHMVWRPCVQLKINFFTWEAASGRILTLDMLQMRVFL